jgi:hypothetical protein
MNKSAGDAHWRSNFVPLSHAQVIVCLILQDIEKIFKSVSVTKTKFNQHTCHTISLNGRHSFQ